MANSGYLDNNLNFRFVWLNSGELVHLQSRGLSLSVCGYLPISLGNKPNYLRDLIDNGDDTLLNLGNELVSYSEADGNTRLLDTAPMVFIFPGMEYNSNGKYLLKNTTPQYKENLVDYQDHLFKNIRAMNTAEMRFVGHDTDTKYDPPMAQPAAAGSIQLSYDISNETFGSYISNSFYVDAIMIFGQVYYDRTAGDSTSEAQLQKIVPLGLIIYADDREMNGNSEQKQRPFIQPGKMNGVVVRETLIISLLQGDFKIDSIADDQNFKDWKDFAGRFHLVNDNLTTSARLFLVGNEVDRTEVGSIDGIDRLSADGRTYACHDRLYLADFNQNWDDANDDFASPAMVTCMTSAQGGYKNPQLLMAQVAKDGTVASNVWDGVAHSYWTEQVDMPDRSYSGSLYNVDWIGRKRPGVNIFCSDSKHLYVDELRSKDADVSASFGGGFQMMASRSYASRYATNLFGSDNYLRGNALAIGSQQVHYYQSGFNADRVANDRKTNNGSTGSMFINSEYLDIDSSGGGTDYLTTIAADNINLMGTSKNVNNERRVTILNGEFQQVMDSNRLLMLNVKGRYQNGSWTHGGASRTTNSIIANGYNLTNSVNKSIVIGDNNSMFGIDNSNPAEGCQIYGSNNRIDAVNATNGQPRKITVIGHGLRNDQRQQIFERSQEPCKTLILGQDNNVYTQLDTVNALSFRTVKGLKGLKGLDSKTNRSFSWTDYSNNNVIPVAIKQIVVGGWKPKGTKHKIQRYNMAEFSVDNTNLNDSILTLMDVKGRSIDYTSRGVNVAVQETHSQDSYDYYNYRQIGGINWGKLIQLLNRLEYDPVTRIVSYNIENGDMNDPNNQCDYYDTLNNSTRLYDLVRNDVGIGPLPLNFEEA